MADKLAANIHELQDAAALQESFMGSFAHEMKNPMTSIIGYAELIRSQLLTPEEEQVVERLRHAFVPCEKLQRHIRFLFS